MGTFLVYILKSAVCLAMFYLFYRLLLSKETFHRFNRMALLGVMLLSCLLPLVKVTVEQASPVNAQVMSMEDLLLMYQWNSEAVVEEGSRPFHWQEGLVLVYFVGLFFVIVRHLWSLGRMLYLIRHSRCERLDNGIRLVVHRRKLAPFSWMRYIVISETDLKESGHHILVHEMAHIHHRHSWDLLLTEACAWLQWFNPAIWLLKQELQNIHEYEADEEVLRQGINAKEYQMLLIKKAVGARLYSIANSFNHSSLKKRITMMIRKKSNPWARAKYLYVLPLAAVTVAAFARPEISKPLDEISSVKVNDLSAVLETYADKNVSNPAEKTKLKMKVVDEEGKPIIAATVLVANTTNGTLTDENGNFTLEVGSDQSIQVAYIGMSTVTMSVKDCLKKADQTIVLTESDTKKYVKVVASAPQTVVSDDQTFSVVEQMPEYPGGMRAGLEFMARNLRYPTKAREAGKQGRVIVQFVVRKDGSLSDFKVLCPVDPWLDAEAIRVISTMPKWKPGMQDGKPVSVKFTLPVTFMLEGTNNKPKSGDNDVVVVGYGVQKSEESVDVPTIKLHNPMDELSITGDFKIDSVGSSKASGVSPLVIMDGLEVSDDVIKKLNPNKIQSVSVLKNEAATAKYGKKGKFGVILITTKRE
ncbi:M56 family metallopeptidase [Phocaeicola plebeius]|jgi:TonB family protein|uniref:TonB family protein n=1 Tax=Phocaeicola plebeius TaxID=310297 RepID=A0A3E4VWE1_9BACT|nr:M56 family metallopeptidase [Phocaeicola plebeius]RGK56790.1 TonB family protein [Phocaeicola plebeius]RGM34253.1 TonB family protein [Phocaeicola plebeius]RGZ56277.1 TonB family protein [Phocaeicola plebeius]RHJ68774.1 TonB family protein [Phocaeicola plebeius]